MVAVDTKLSQIIDYISEKNPRHGKKLRQSLGKMDTAFYKEAELFFSNYEVYAKKQDKDMQYGMDAYLQMIADMMYEYLHFARTGEYSCKSFEDAYKKVYNNPKVMEYYMHGLLFSQFLWKHHYTIVNFFSDTIIEYGRDITNYLEIGGGHGLYLSKAIDLLGKEVAYTMVDISESSLEMAKSFVTNGKVDFILQDIYKFTPTVPIDFITMGEVLEHVEEPKKLLERLHTLLSDDGTLFITTPTNAPAIDHIYLFRNEKEIEDLIKESGFTIEHSIGVYSEDVSKEEGARRNIALLYGAFLKKK